MSHLILSINPGSTSTKISLFRDYKELFTESIVHSPDELNGFASIADQYAYRRDSIIKTVEAKWYHMSDIDAYAGRSGAMVSSPAGAYAVNDLLLKENSLDKPMNHASSLTTPMVVEFSERFGGKAYVVNSHKTDEFVDIARVTGWKGVWRSCSVHLLNHKAVGSYIARKLGKKPEEVNLIIAHLGGGNSITANLKGRIIDASHGGLGDGPMAPTRSGSIMVNDVINMAFSGEYTKQDLFRKTAIAGGLTDQLGTDDARTVEERICGGDRYAKLIYDGMLYQIAKYIGSLAVSLEGHVDRIVLTGGMAHSDYVCSEIERQISWIAPVERVPGEKEMEALNEAVLLVMKGETPAHEYTGIPMYDPDVLMNI